MDRQWTDGWIDEWLEGRLDRSINKSMSRQCLFLAKDRILCQSTFVSPLCSFFTLQPDTSVTSLGAVQISAAKVLPFPSFTCTYGIPFLSLKRTG